MHIPSPLPSPSPAPALPLRARARDLALALGGAGGLAAIMSVRGDVTRPPAGGASGGLLNHWAALWHAGHVPGGVLLGALLLLAAIVGLLGLLGDSPLDLRGDERAPARDDASARRPLWRREGAWLVGLCALLYLPLAGAYGLWDPWETHYAEVAREVLARDDWITLWWGQEGWFMSKPVLIFWLAALGMGTGSTFGLSFFRDSGPGAHEWWVRAPIVLLAIAAVYALYRAVARAWGRRAGLCAGAVLATTPFWFFLAHQAMTDMPFVAPLVIAMAFLMVGVTADPRAHVEARRVALPGGRAALRVSGWHLATAAVLALVLPQLLYLLTRPLTFGCPESGAAAAACAAALAGARLGTLQLPVERFASGSAGNSAPADALLASVPGSPPWEDRYSALPLASSFAQGLAWLALAALVLASLRRERRVQALAFAMVYLFGAVSFLGKGPAGLGVPEVVMLGFMLVTGRWSLLRQLGLLRGAAIFLLCGMPWYVAVYCRLGQQYLDRFVGNDLLGRAFVGVHGDTGTVGYFVTQLAYGLFPWTGLAPAALLGWRLYVPPTATEAQRGVVRIAALWFAATFTLFSLMVTKFHHYIFPAVPAAAVLVGLLLDRMLGRATPTPFRAARAAHRLLGAALLVGASAALVLGLAWCCGDPRGLIPAAGAHAARPALGALLVALALGGLAAAHRLAPPPRHSGGRRGAAAHGALAAAALSGAALLALVARDVAAAAAAGPAGAMPGAARLEQLFTYNYQRAFPSASLDYRPVLAGFGAAAVAYALLLAVRRLRPLAARATLALAACFAAWSLDVYVIDLSRHFSQRALLARYYAARGGGGEPAPLAAYQMNWKGENFYTGNHAAMLECGLPQCESTRTADWLAGHRGGRAFFLTTHGAAPGLIAEVARAGGRAWRLTDARENNMFVLLEGAL